MPDQQLIYCDSPIFISYLTGAPLERVATIDDIFALQESKAIQIVISTFVIAEVRRLPVPGRPGPPPGDETNVETEPYDPRRLERVRQLFNSDLLEYQVLTPRIAQEAAGIGDRFPKLTPGDCVHIATAIAVKADYLFTWDGASPARRRPGAMLRYDGRIGIPPLTIREPFPPYGPLLDPATPT